MSTFSRDKVVGRLRTSFVTFMFNDYPQGKGDRKYNKCLFFFLVDDLMINKHSCFSHPY